MYNKKHNTKDRKNKKRGFINLALLFILLVVLIVSGLGAGTVIAYVKTAPSVNVQDFTKDMALTTSIYDKDDNYLESLHGIENRTYVELSGIKKYTRDAFIAIEDERFAEHPGVDIRRIIGALWVDIKTGRFEQGASTITQQLIKNTVLTPEKELKRKIQEAYLALKLEKVLTKDQILEYYLNTIYLGGSAYGVQAAAEYYFAKDVDELTIAESALIAGLTQSPSRYNPYNNVKATEVYGNRQLTVLSKMLEMDMITEDEYVKAKSEKLAFKKRDDNTILKYQWFVETAIDRVSSDLRAEYSYSDDEIRQMIYSGGLKIYTTIDPEIQDTVEKIGNDPKYYPNLRKDIAVWGKENIIQPQVGIVISDYKTGEVRAVLGGRGKQPLRSQNRAADTRYARQPGSAMKPIAVYAPALEMGYAPSSVIDDSPFTPGQSAMAPDWPKEGPHNFDDKYRGFTTIRDAVKYSSNVVASKLILEIGSSTSTEYIEKFGISTLVKSGRINDSGPAKALGGLSKGVTPLEMSAAYGVFGNGGIYVEPVLYTKVLDSEGNILLEKKPEKNEVISPQSAYLMVDVLKGVINGGTGSAVRTKGKFTSMPSAGKTGTTENQADAYFAGLTPYYSGAIWIGHDKPSLSLKLTSAETAAMWGEIMREIHDGLTVKDFDRPKGIVSAPVCLDSGDLPTSLCERDPRGSRVATDLFIEGKVPSESCDIHVAAMVNTVTGKLANQYTPPELVKEMVFIKRKYPVDKRVGDYNYQIPTEEDAIPDIIEEPLSNPVPDTRKDENSPDGQ